MGSGNRVGSGSDGLRQRRLRGRPGRGADAGPLQGATGRASRRARAGRPWPADLELADGVVRVVGAPHRRLPLGQLAAACAPGAPLPDGMSPGLEATHYFLAPRPTFASGLHIAVVTVERETGRVEIVDYVAVSDAGRLINPLIVEGQIHGGVAQGVGGALYEQLGYDEHGQPRP